MVKTMVINTYDFIRSFIITKKYRIFNIRLFTLLIKLTLVSYVIHTVCYVDFLGR